MLYSCDKWTPGTKSEYIMFGNLGNYLAGVCTSDLHDLGIRNSGSLLMSCGLCCEYGELQSTRKGEPIAKNLPL
jgi:hypothetical protein